MRIGKLLVKSLSTCICFLTAGQSLAEGLDRYEKELLEINSKIKAAFERNDLKSTLPLYEKSIEILRKTGRKQDLYAALKNYEAVKQRVFALNSSDSGHLTTGGFLAVTERELPANSYEIEPKRELSNFETRSRIQNLSRGNIIPYQKAAMSRIAKNWNLQRSSGQWAAKVEIARDGKVLTTHLIMSSFANEGRDALRVIESTIFAPLPEWYRESSLTLEVTSASIMALVTEKTSTP